jgi:predicted RNase H-like HicB family nuclease
VRNARIAAPHPEGEERNDRVIKHDDGWWYGWIEEVPSVIAQERSREELLVPLRECLAEALEMNRRDALESAEQDYAEEPIAL